MNACPSSKHPWPGGRVEGGCGGGNAWQWGWCGKRGSPSGVGSGDRHSGCWLCGLGKVWCTHEPRVSWDDWGESGGLSERAGGAGTACSSGSLCWQQVPAVAPLRKRSFCAQATMCIRCDLDSSCRLQRWRWDEVFGFAGEPKTRKRCSAASWEASPQVPWQRQYHALKPEVDLK